VSEDYDPDYLRGILVFNAGDYFEAHEFWEAYWLRFPPERRFIQGLIHATVSLYHASRGNRTGSKRLFESGKRYTLQFPSPCLGLECESFWEQMTATLSDYFCCDIEDPSRIRWEAVPKIELDPVPQIWPKIPGEESME
jgi:uncharacterized protein